MTNGEKTGMGKGIEDLKAGRVKPRKEAKKLYQRVMNYSGLTEL
jgi:hypothetical protein